MRAVMARFGDDPTEAIVWMDQGDRDRLCDFRAARAAPCRSGRPDRPAHRADAAEHIDGLVRALVERGAPRLTLIGGLAPPMAWLAPDVRRLVPAEADALAGALYLGRGTRPRPYCRHPEPSAAPATTVTK